MPTKKPPAVALRTSARLRASRSPLLALVAAAFATVLLAVSLLPGTAVGQSQDDAITKDPTPIARAVPAGTYFHTGLGVMSLMDYDDGYALTAALGNYAVFDRFRGEVELSLASQLNIRALALTANAYYDYHNRTAWTPFVGLGVGIESEAFSDRDGWGYGNAWGDPVYRSLQAIVHGNLGVAYAATDDLAVQLVSRAFGWTGHERGWIQFGLRLNR